MRHHLPIIAAAVLAFATAPLVQGAGQTMATPGQFTVPSRDRNARPAASGTATVTGTVVSLDGGRGVRRALVRLSSGSGPGLSTRTDDEGAFAFAQVPAGEFTLTASKPGYLDVTYGQRKPGSGLPGTSLSIAEGAHLEHLSLTIPRGAVITGVVVDDAGEPAFGVDVHALRLTLRNGERASAQEGQATTDDRGMYRIPVLRAGQYVVMATPPNDPNSADPMQNVLSQVRAQGLPVPPPPPESPDTQVGPSSGYAPLYYPSTTSAATAQTLTLAVGEERQGIDLQLVLVPLGRITGTVVGGDPAELRNVQVRLIDSAQTPLGGSYGVRATTAGADGRFTFTGVPPGQYAVTARSGGQILFFNTASNGSMVFARVAARGAPPPDPGSAPPRPMWASTDLAVDGLTPSVVTLALQNGMAVSGKLAFEGTTPPPTDLTSLRVSLSPLHPDDPNAPGAQVSLGDVTADGQFRIPDVMPGTYRATLVGAPGLWFPKSFEAGGRDALDFGVDVKPNEDVAGATFTLTDRSIQLVGTIEDPSGRPTSDYTIIIAPENQEYWLPGSRRIQATRPATDGHFSFGGLPEGDYRLIAVTDVEDGQWYDRSYLTAIIGASIPVTLHEGDRRIQDIRVTR